ncbi:MAG: hypothetical protein R3Y21_00725 [Mycoplasmatota bacterium]
MTYTKEEIKLIRKKVMDFYLSAMPFNYLSVIDVERCDKMDDNEIIVEAIKLKIITKKPY